MTTCATASRALAEPLAGTAATARTWLLIEQPGPWGRQALTESHLDPRLGKALEEPAGAHGARVALIRRPGRHADGAGGPGHHRVFLARTVPGDSWVRTTELPSRGGLEALRSLDFAALDGHDVRSGEAEGFHGSEGPQGPGERVGGSATLGPEWRPYEGDPLVLVCTNGKRDRCCALLGRPLAAELEASGGANVWEITHIGGHRFAPTLLVLPYGYAYGRLGASAVKGVLDAVRDGHVLTEGCRGRSAWGRPGQTADLAVRERTGEVRAHALTVLASAEEPDGARWRVTVGHEDGRRWHVVLAEATDGPALAASCGAAPATPVRMDVERFEALPPE
ncbi:sucrase ferredoxin [Streptomyces sp. NBC_01795]|uniref:sucrase ferredoxin n=1 Tax=Streptomyces sp. NBC_01795 TaxID=2975943 RepID=UPI002DDA963A|nr:sucrase ferredoxin [Streptomyces sp. NBC_01795]WSA91954.1 sucrase ferredoxin [Streptomyces sp. NBC_01795]